MRARRERHEMLGFTLIELVIAIVVVGILSAVALVGIAGLTTTASSKACDASKDAAISASAIYFTNKGKYPVEWDDMSAETFVRPDTVTVSPSDPKVLVGKG